MFWIKSLLAASCCICAFAVSAFPRAAPVPGGVAIFDLGEVAAASGTDAAPKAEAAGRALAVVPHAGRWYALLGIALQEKPGAIIHITARFADGRETRMAVKVLDKHYPEERLIVKDTRKVEPNPEDIQRITRETAHLKTIRDTYSYRPVQADFQLPTHTPRSSRFGLRRIFNGQARNPHAGLDLRGQVGTPIRAPADAEVLDAADYFFNGNTLFLDHGGGLITAYLHLSKFYVQPGERIKAGTLIGEVGATGRVTGPHLHWMVYLNGIPVDPELFIPPE